MIATDYGGYILMCRGFYSVDFGVLLGLMSAVTGVSFTPSILILIDWFSSSSGLAWGASTITLGACWTLSSADARVETYLSRMFGAEGWKCYFVVVGSGIECALCNCSAICANAFLTGSPAVRLGTIDDRGWVKIAVRSVAVWIRWPLSETDGKGMSWRENSTVSQSLVLLVSGKFVLTHL